MFMSERERKESQGNRKIINFIPSTHLTSSRCHLPTQQSNFINLKKRKFFHPEEGRGWLEGGRLSVE